MTVLLLPPRFFDDHADRELPTPEVLGRRGRSYVVALEDDRLRELFSDACYYAGSGGPDQPGLNGLRASARATRDTIAEAKGWAIIP